MNCVSFESKRGGAVWRLYEPKLVSCLFKQCITDTCAPLPPPPQVAQADDAETLELQEVRGLCL